MKIASRQQGFTIIGMLIAAAIVCILVWLCFQERDQVPTGSTQQMIKEAGIDTRTHKSTLDSTKKLIGEIETKGPDIGKIMDQY
ncbi:MAG: type II secretion system protein [Candidatus Omnitrophica bacterium]|nr:type II secretion system protein [Candidatus Omnitrophota bacterium]MCB9720138.1 type II secretion system protein [Candidatus Omnitrophota bacterium]